MEDPFQDVDSCAIFLAFIHPKISVNPPSRIDSDSCSHSVVIDLSPFSLSTWERTQLTSFLTPIPGDSSMASIASVLQMNSFAKTWDNKIDDCSDLCAPVEPIET